MFMVGLCLGPPQHFFYKFLDGKLPSRGVRNVTKKVLVEQLTASPLYIIGFFIAYGLIDDKLKSCMQELKQKFWNIYMVMKRAK